MSPLPVSYELLDAGAATKAAEVSASTVTAVAVGTGQHMLMIEGYSLLKGKHRESGSFIESSAFKAGGHTWKIRCFLNGNTKENAGFVSLFLYLCSGATGPAVHAEFEFALMRHKGTPPASGHQEGTPSMTSQGVRTFGGKDNNLRNWGFLQFISVKELERSMCLQDDCLGVQCTVTVIRERTVKETHDLVRLGMFCKCDDDLCKRQHARPAETFLERFANFCYSICRGGR